MHLDCFQRVRLGMLMGSGGGTRGAQGHTRRDRCESGVQIPNGLLPQRESSLCFLKTVEEVAKECILGIFKKPLVR